MFSQFRRPEAEEGLVAKKRCAQANTAENVDILQSYAETSQPVHSPGRRGRVEAGRDLAHDTTGYTRESASSCSMHQQIWILCSSGGEPVGHLNVRPRAQRQAIAQ